MRTKIKKIMLPIFIVCVGLTLVLFGCITAVSFYLPDEYYTVDGAVPSFNTAIPVTCERISGVSTVNAAQDGGGFTAILKVMGIFPVKQVSVSCAQNTDVVVLGDTFGIKIFTKGVLITDMQAVDAEEGSVNPGKEAGLEKGDIIVEINGTLPRDTNHAATLISGSGGSDIIIKAERNGQPFETVLKPRFSQSEKTYKAGLWIKDSSAGIGTLTFYSPSLNVMAGLGHGVVDTDVLTLLPLSAGEMVPSEIFSFTKSRNGAPGELKGRFLGGSVGKIFANDDTGVYAVPSCGIIGKSMQIAMKQEVSVGEAQIITTIDTNGPKVYSCRIKKINYNHSDGTKNMLICITDKELLSKTGGIVQGMSGSPIIQNGKLIGAVTHVLIDDPTQGYAVFAENMLQTARQETEQLKKAS